MPLGAYQTNGILYSLDYGSDWTSQMWGGFYGLPNVWFPSSEFILHGTTYGTNGLWRWVTPDIHLNFYIRSGLYIHQWQQLV